MAMVRLRQRQAGIHGDGTGRQAHTPVSFYSSKVLGFVTQLPGLLDPGIGVKEISEGEYNAGDDGASDCKPVAVQPVSAQPAAVQLADLQPKSVPSAEPAPAQK